METRFVIEIEASVETVFYWVVQPEAVLQWLDHLTAYEFTNEGDEWVGTTVHQVWDDDEDSALTGTITAFEEHKHFTIELEGGKFTVTVDYQFEDMGEKTRLTQETEFTYKGMTKVIEKTMGAKVKQSYEAQAKSNFARLMDLCEADERIEE